MTLTHGTGPESVYVYYFESQSIDKTYWPCKIGRTRSSDPWKRIQSQQASMQEKPTIGLIISTDNCLRDEAILHALFDHRKLDTHGNEWFNTQPQHVLNAFKICKHDLEIGQQLKIHRVTQNMTQAELAKCAGLRQATVSNVERGRLAVQLNSLIEMARELKLKIVLVDDDDEHEVNPFQH